MKIDFNKLYNYIFSDWADIEKSIKDLDLNTDTKEKRRKKAESDIQNFFKELIGYPYPEKFRSALR